MEILNGFVKLLIRETNKGAIRYIKCYTNYKKKVKRALFTYGIVFSTK